ncbi:MAG: ribonuclease III [Sandaracinaceae bacterium]
MLDRLGHRFGDLALLRQALTHRSFVHERPDLAPAHNETLEFLGDSVVGLAAATLLHERFPGAREGELTRRRSDLVCERTLARIAEGLELGPALRLGRGEEKSGGRTKARLLASALEASIAAVLLDAGLTAAVAVARRLLEPYADSLEPGAEDFKSRIQELLQAEGRGAPRYELVGHEGPEHARTFHVAIIGDDGELARGQGRSKSEAEQAAARAAHALLTKGRESACEVP